MVEFKINVANSNLARKINFLYNGKIKRSFRRTRPIKKRIKNKKFNGKKALVIRFSFDSIFHIPNFFYKTFLVYICSKKNDSKLKRMIALKIFLVINTIC